MNFYFLTFIEKSENNISFLEAVFYSSFSYNIIRGKYIISISIGEPIMVIHNPLTHQAKTNKRRALGSTRLCQWSFDVHGENVGIFHRMYM